MKLIPVFRRLLQKSSCLCFCFGCLFLSAGCVFSGSHPKPAASGRASAGDNVFNAASQLPPGLKRIAVLPSTAGSTGDLSAGREVLEPVLQQELAKTARFESVPVTQDQLLEWTGRGEWRSVDELPAGFFKKIREKTGCHAVFFSHLTHYHAYPPLLIGWRMALVDCDEPLVRWAVDELYDSGQETTAKAARLYFKKHLPRHPLADSAAALASPLRFGQFVTGALVATLPPR